MPARRSGRRPELERSTQDDSGELAKPIGDRRMEGSWLTPRACRGVQALTTGDRDMTAPVRSGQALGALAAGLLLSAAPWLSGQARAEDAAKPNIVVIMGDDIGWSNIGVYNQGVMAGRTPNLDPLAHEGMRVTPHYPQGSCHPRPADLLTRQPP